MTNESWRSKPRKIGGSVKVKNGIVYARIQYIDKSTGKRKEKSRVAENKTHARKLIGEMRKELENFGQDVLQADKLTFRELAERYEKIKLVPASYSDGRKVAGKRSLKPLLSALKPLVKHFGGKAIRNIKPGDLEFYKTVRLKEPVVIPSKVKVKNENGGRKKFVYETATVERPRKIATVNRELMLMRAIFNFAKCEDLISKSPFENAKVISLSAEIERDRVMSLDEEKRLLAACVDHRAHLKPLIITAVDTAMRRGELFKLQWQDVDFKSREITVQATNAKTEKTRKIGMTNRVKEELSKLWEMSPKDKKQLVFGITNTIKRSWKSACDAAGISDLHFHDLRHSATTRLIRAKVPESEVMKITGHTQTKTFLRYLNLTNESVTNSANLLDNYLSNQSTNSDEIEVLETIN